MDPRDTSPSGQRVYAPADDGTHPVGVVRDRPYADSSFDPRTDDEPRGRAVSRPPRRNRVVIALIVVLGLLALSVVGWFAGILVSKVVGTSEVVGGGGPTAPTTVTAAPTSGSTAPSASGAPITVVGATLFDPPPGDGEENPARVKLSYDGNAGTIWPTLQYSGSAAFGNIKPGVGVVYDLGSEQPLRRVKVTTTLPGSTAEIRTGPADADELSAYKTVSPGQTLSGETTFDVAAGTKARYVLVWITQLVAVEGKFQANVAEVAFTG